MDNNIPKKYTMLFTSNEIKTISEMLKLSITINPNISQVSCVNCDSCGKQLSEKELHKKLYEKFSNKYLRIIN